MLWWRWKVHYLSKLPQQIPRTEIKAGNTPVNSLAVETISGPREVGPVAVATHAEGEETKTPPTHVLHRDVVSDLVTYFNFMIGHGTKH